MKRGSLAVVLLAVLPAHAQGSPDKAGGGDEAAVRQVEADVVDAFRRNDADALDRLWAPDYTFINPSGQLLTKPQRLGLFRTGKFHYESVEVEEMNVRVHGTSAIVTYKSTVAAQRSATKIAGQRRVTTMLVKEDGRWRVVAQQSTPIEVAPKPQ